MKFHRIYSVPLNLGRHINKIEALWSENSRGLLVRVERFERSAPWTQITCATNCATPGYSVFLHDTMRRKKKQVFRVCRRWYDLWQIIRTSSKHKLSSTLRPYRPNILCGLFWFRSWMDTSMSAKDKNIYHGRKTDWYPNPAIPTQILNKNNVYIIIADFLVLCNSL